MEIVYLTMKTIFILMIIGDAIIFFLNKKDKERRYSYITILTVICLSFILAIYAIGYELLLH